MITTIYALVGWEVLFCVCRAVQRVIMFCFCLAYPLRPINKTEKKRTYQNQTTFTLAGGLEVIFR